MRAKIDPFECEIESLGARGVGVGTAPNGRKVSVRAAPPGARLLVVPTARSKSGLTARRLQTLRPPRDAQVPRCAQFGLCGGCSLQELGLPDQRRHKLALALAEIGEHLDLSAVRCWPVRGSDAAYGYRNKIELSFGSCRWTSEEERDKPKDGRFLGFHPPGRFDRIVDCPRCELVSDEVNEIIARVRALTLAEGAPLPYDNKTHQGFFRHLLVREAGDQRMVVLFTATDPAQAPLIEAIAEVVAPLVKSFQWRLNDGLADVARGEIARIWGPDFIEERLGLVTFRLSCTSFFQTNTAGAAVLYDTVGESLGDSCGSLLDLYCGVGSIGLYLAGRATAVLGIEENPESVRDAEQNALRNGIQATFLAAKVEHALDTIDAQIAGGAKVSVVVDPPRAGLHPSVAARVARSSLSHVTYVACNPASLGRDGAILAAAGLRLTDLWPVDLFPQTGHIEVVGRFVR